MTCPMGNPHPGQNKKTHIVCHKRQIAFAPAARPSDIVIPVLERPRCRTEGQCAKISGGTLDQIPNLSPAEVPVPEIVASLKESKPNLRFLCISAADRIDLNLPEVFQSALNIRYVQSNGSGGFIPERVINALLWQIDNRSRIELVESLAAGHLLRTAAWRNPVQPTADPSRQIKSRNRRFVGNRLANTVQHRTGKILATDIHGPCNRSIPLPLC